MPAGGTVTIRNCIIYNIGRGAISNQGGAWGCTINIENCTIHNTGTSGTQADGQGGINNSASVNGSNLNVDNRTVQISGSTATFSAAMPAAVDVGDVLRYGAFKGEAAFIQAKTSSTVFTVKAHDGSDPVPCPAGTGVDVYESESPSTVNVTNTISVGSQSGADFKNPGAAWGGCSKNISSDSSARRPPRRVGHDHGAGRREHGHHRGHSPRDGARGRWRAHGPGDGVHSGHAGCGPRGGLGIGRHY